MGDLDVEVVVTGIEVDIAREVDHLEEVTKEEDDLTLLRGEEEEGQDQDLIVVEELRITRFNTFYHEKEFLNHLPHSSISRFYCIWLYKSW